MKVQHCRAGVSNIRLRGLSFTAGAFLNHVEKLAHTVESALTK